MKNANECCSTTSAHGMGRNGNGHGMNHGNSCCANDRNNSNCCTGNRSFISTEERIEKLEKYKGSLEKELRGVEEFIAGLKK